MTDLTDDEMVEALTGNVVITKSVADGALWCGTEAWLVRDDTSRAPSEGGVDKLLALDYSSPLTRVVVELTPVVAESPTGLLRLYERPDGQVVYLSDSRVRAVEAMTADEDEFGNPYTTPLDLHQANNRYGPVGVYRGANLIALVMPQKITNT